MTENGLNIKTQKRIVKDSPEFSKEKIALAEEN